MQKQAPTFGRIAAMVGFALSCFGLLLFLWLEFGGPAPLKPKGYRVDIPIPEAATLGLEADVRVAGVEIGKVKEKRINKGANNTLVTVEIKPRYAPIPKNAKARLRDKTILGETYIELTSGDRSKGYLQDGETLAAGNVAEAIQLDEVLSTFDEATRGDFRAWQQDLSKAVRERGIDLNQALGNLPGFVEEGDDLFEVLDERRANVRGLVRNTGVVFKALTEREGQLRALIENSDTVFTAIQREQESFAEVFRVFPTFLDESRLTFGRLERFSRDTRPLTRALKPAFDDLAPTLDSVADFGPDLQRLFRDMDPLITLSKKSLPATREIFDGLRPVLGELGPWLGELNPILNWIGGEHQHTLVDMFANLGVATAAKTGTITPGAPGHYLRQFGPSGAETVAVHGNRLPSNRGNAYINPLSLVGPKRAKDRIIESFDCKNSGGEKEPGGTPSSPACVVQGPLHPDLTRFPHVDSEKYGAGK